jgi:SAM-dependent MidA family methyltransferase
MAEALYGDRGFYVAAGAPGRNFRTAAHTGEHWARAIHALVERVDQALGEPASFAVVDVGAGGGELLEALAGLAPARWSLIGVDVAARPTGLATTVGWQPEPPATITGVLLAVELLDVVPVDVVERTSDGTRIVEVSRDGEESLGEVVAAADAAWLDRWWPLSDVGDRAEIGRPRDETWQSLTGRLDRGVALAVDYATVPARDVAGTLAGYRDGRQVLPVPDGSTDITAHVVFESLTRDADVVLRQREALQSLAVTADRPSYDGDPGSYLAAMSTAAAAAELLDRDGLGGFTWLVHAEGVNHPLPTAGP